MTTLMMTDAEVNFMILVYGPIFVITFAAIGFIIGRSTVRGALRTKNHVKALYKRRNLKLVHSDESVVSSRNSEGKLKVVDF